MLRRIGIVLGGVGVIAAVVAVALLVSSGDEPADPGDDDEPLLDEEEDGELDLFLEEDAPQDGGSNEDRGGGREWRDRRGRGGWDEGDEESRRRRREEMRERFRNMTPEERAAWARERVQITPLGEGEPEIAPEEVMAALREVGPQTRECIRDNGGFRAMFGGMRRSSDGGVQRPTLSFDVTPGGTIDPASIAIEPPVPDAFQGCFAASLEEARLPSPGPEPARVEVRLGRGRPRDRR